MKEIEIKDRTPLLVEQLVDVWETSVRETHLFLSGEEIEEIKKFVPTALMAVPHLLVETDINGRPVAFMGIDDGKLEMLFIRQKDFMNIWDLKFVRGQRWMNRGIHILSCLWK